MSDWAPAVAIRVAGKCAGALLTSGAISPEEREGRVLSQRLGHAKRVPADTCHTWRSTDDASQGHPFVAGLELSGQGEPESSCWGNSRAGSHPGLACVGRHEWTSMFRDTPVATSSYHSVNMLWLSTHSVWPTCEVLYNQKS